MEQKLGTTKAGRLMAAEMRFLRSIDTKTKEIE
jgi:hypothetical protein